MRTERMYVHIADNVVWYKNVQKNNEENKELWLNKFAEQIERLEKLLPHGSGIDCGCKIDLERSTSKKVIIHTEFHHMDECGFYDGWTTHDVILTPDFGGFEMRITGRDKNGIKDYLYDTFYFVLNEEVEL